MTFPGSHTLQRPRRNLILLLLLAGLVPAGLPAQDNTQRSKLEKNKKDLENEISYTNQLLSETKKKKQISVNQVVILNNQIQKREKLINTINSQVDNLYGQVEQNQQSVEDLQKELKNLKNEYARMIYLAYRNRNAYQKLMFIFAAKDFNQAYQRLKYFRQYSEYRRKQVDLILATQEKLNRKIQELNLQKEEKLGLLKSKEKEKTKLTREKDEKNQTISRLKQEEKNLKKKLKDKEKARKKLQQAIERMIAEEIRKSAPASSPGAKPSQEVTLMLTPEEKELSSSFTSNRGKLPWPVEKGIISSTFGEHEHPVLKGIKTKNNGINILTNGGSNVRSVFNGTVTGIMSIPNLNEVVIIRHGEYLSVYSNLDAVLVKKGDKVKTKQVIGRVFTDPEESKTELHFELWEGKRLLDPAAWLAR